MILLFVIQPYILRLISLTDGFLLTTQTIEDKQGRRGKGWEGAGRTLGKT